jgi:hypothetical protein
MTAKSGINDMHHRSSFRVICRAYAINDNYYPTQGYWKVAMYEREIHD